jgi:hypothetical protein
VIPVIRVPYVTGQDEDGVWCASARLRPGVGVFGDGPTTMEAVMADLCAGLGLLLDVACNRGEVASEDPEPGVGT